MRKETKLVNTLISASKAPAAAMCLLGLGLIGCDQPKPLCNISVAVTGGYYAARYTLEEKGNGDCDSLANEVLALGSFYAPKSDDSPNYRAVSVAIQPSGTQNLFYSEIGIVGTPENPDFAPSDDTILYTWGAFDDSEPDSDNFCHITEMDPAKVKFPAYNAYEAPDPNDPTGETMVTNPAGPAVNMKYDFSNVEVYMTAASPGRQFSADLAYTLNGCTATYRVDAIFPATWCGVPVDPDVPDGEQMPDDTACDIEAFNGMAVECDPVSLNCIPSKSIPSFD